MRVIQTLKVKTGFNESACVNAMEEAGGDYQKALEALKARQREKFRSILGSRAVKPEEQEHGDP